MQNILTSKLEDFFSRYKKEGYKKGDLIIRAFEEPSGVFYLKDGFVKMNFIYEDGSEITLNIFKPHSFFPMIWAIAGTENAYFFQAMTSVSVYKAPKDDVLKFLRENPDVLFDLARRIIVGFDGLLLNIRHILFGSAIERVTSAIFLSARRFGEKQADGKTIIKLKLTHQDIANIAGITRETASISIKKLEKQKLITYKKRFICVNNLETFEKDRYEFSAKDISPISNA